MFKSNEDLEKIRADAAERLKVEAEKRKLKDDIKRIKAATLRAKLGITKDKLEKNSIHPMNKRKPSLLKKGGKALFDGFMAWGESIDKAQKRANRGHNLGKKGRPKDVNMPFDWGV